MAMHKVESELVKAGSIKKVADEDRQDRLKRIHDAIGEFEADDWEDLTEEAQHWYNASTAARDADNEMPDFDEEDSYLPKKKKKEEDDSADEEDNDSEEDTEEDSEEKDPKE